MSDFLNPPAVGLVQPAATPDTMARLLTTFREFYRQDVGATEDVHRSLPFFGTALGIVIAALAYAAGQLPKFFDISTCMARITFVISGVLLLLAVIEAACVLVWISLAIGRRDYQRIAPETALRERFEALRAYHGRQGLTGAPQDAAILQDTREVLLDSYAEVTPVTHRVNQERYRFVPSPHRILCVLRYGHSEHPWLSLLLTRQVFCLKWRHGQACPRQVCSSGPGVKTVDPTVGAVGEAGLGFQGTSGQVEAKPSGSLTYWVTSGADVLPSLSRRRS